MWAEKPTGRCWHLSVSPGTYPSRQRGCAATAAQSGETQGIPCAVSRDERHCAVLTRSANAAARLLLRSQAERKAASASHSGETQGDASPPPVHTSPAPTRLFYDGSHIRMMAIRKAAP